MADKLITIAHLPYAQAELLRTMLKDIGIESTLKNVNLIQGAAAMGVKVKVLPEDVERAWPVVDKLLGKDEVDDIPKDNNIVVLVDFSKYAYRAALAAFEIAERLGSKIIFYHVINQLDFLTVPYTEVVALNTEYFENMKLREEIANKQLSEFLQRLTEELGVERWQEVENEQIIRIGYPEDDILSYISKNPPRLIVMGSKGPEENESSIVGSTTAEVIYKSKVPVLVIPIKSEGIKLSSKTKLVYTTNFDKKDLLSITKLLDLTAPFDCKISCIHIGNASSSKLSEAKIESLQNSLNERYPDIEINCCIVAGDDFLQTLEKYIKENDVDMISLTTHRRNMLARLLNPSVTRKMVFHTNNPLLVFHS